MDSIKKIDLNHFKFIKTIGRGQFGVVSLLYDDRTSKYYAAKEEFDNNGNKNTLKIEMRTYSRVNNPSILEFLGYMLLTGDGMGLDLEEGIRYLKLYENNGYKDQQFEYKFIELLEN